MDFGYSFGFFFLVSLVGDWEEEIKITKIYNVMKTEVKDLKNEGALIQLEIFNKLSTIFNSRKLNLYVEKLKNSEFKEDPLIKGMIKNLELGKKLYKGSNKLPKWAPVQESTVLVLLDYIQRMTSSLTQFSQSARGREK